MKQANIRLKLSQTHDVSKVGVTPIEVLFLVAEHHRNAGGNPVTVDEKSIKDTGHMVDKEVDQDVDEIVVVNGKKEIKTTKIKVKKPEWVADNRTDDQELDRLRNKYGVKKINAIASQVRQLPKDFKEAMERGINLSLPTGGILSETKLV